MKPYSNEEMKPLLHGVCEFTDERGYLGCERFTAEQRAYFLFDGFFSDRTFCTASVLLEFETEATAFTLAYKIVRDLDRPDAFDLYAENSLVQSVDFRTLPRRGTLGFALPAGEKRVRLYFPVYARVAVTDFAANAPVQPVSHKKCVLFLGDSITQGFGCGNAGGTFVNVASRILDCETLNQGIGGYYFDAACPLFVPGFSPDAVVVALGTNMHREEKRRERIAAYFKALRAQYPEAQIFAVTPVWRCNEGTDMQKLVETAEFIKEEAAGFGCTVLDGFHMIPNDAAYFADGLHPNGAGMRTYGERLAAALRTHL